MSKPTKTKAATATPPEPSEVVSPAPSPSDGAEPGAQATTLPAVPTLSPQMAERQRVAAILDAKEAKGREDLARHLALHTDMKPEAAIAALAAAPRGNKRSFSERADAAGSPKLSAGWNEAERRGADMQAASDQYTEAFIQGGRR